MANEACSEECGNLCSFREGFDGKKLLSPYNGKDRLAVCALKPEEVLHMRGCPVCWKSEE